MIIRSVAKRLLSRRGLTNAAIPISVQDLVDSIPEPSDEDQAEFDKLYAQYQNDQEEHAQQKKQDPIVRRPGAIALKIGMIGMFDAFGQRHPVTLLKISSCNVLQVKTTPNNQGLVGLQIGTGEKKLKNCTKAFIGHCAKAGVAPKQHVIEFPVSPNAVLPVGTELTASHFVAGQLIDIQGTSNGKGFAGAMKRWGFKGQSATHGVSVAHRSLGSTGNCQDPGRVWKGKKMAGRMGNKLRTVQNMKIMRIDHDQNLLYIRGSVPGRRGNWVRLIDAVRVPTQVSTLPFPTLLEPAPVGSTFAPIGVQKDPFKYEATQ
uniref:Large ribosomal subunit protein uL3m n=1 Tax=Spongospora subterranea TaxID=70186 RepID=A0A0H5RK86_9EUKA|eukprot:CRZ09144.1 hypothetical protein [Spongospora subterranea]